MAAAVKEQHRMEETLEILAHLSLDREIRKPLSVRCRTCDCGQNVESVEYYEKAI